MSLTRIYWLALAGVLALNVYSQDPEYDDPAIRRILPRDTSALGIDGPYVFFYPDVLVSKSIERVDGKLTIRIDTLSYNQRRLQITRDTPQAQQFALRMHLRERPHPTEVPAADSIFVISDIEGNFDALQQLLLAGGVVDSLYNWRFGTGHLVVLGDVFDRGLEVTQCLWLLYRLEHEAPQGHVHVVVGNHEALNFIGFVDYVRNKYRLVSYALSTNVRTLFSEHTVLGEWLRHKNMTLKIGPYLFAHGGLSPLMVDRDLSLKKINRIGRRNYDALELSGDRSLVFGSQGPMWYRGYFQSRPSKYEQAKQTDIDRILHYYQAQRVVVGHTVVDSIAPLFDNKVLPVDVNHRHRLKNGLPTEGLLIRGDALFRIYTNGRRLRLL